MSRASADDAVFREESGPDGPVIHPTPLAGGPWSPEHQHGGPVAALLMRAVERVEAPVPMRVARLTVDMLRAVPLRPLRVEAELQRAGRRIQGIEARVLEGERVLARAQALRVRLDASLDFLAVEEPRHPGLGTPPEAVPELPEEGLEWKFMPGFLRAVDYAGRPARVAGEESSIWTRLRCRLVAGEAPSPLVRLAALADFGAGVGNGLDFQRFTSINPDLSIAVLREPRGEWLGISGCTFRSADGVGQSHGVLHDAEGPVARVFATLLLDRR